jgi:hypothetical protein
VFYIYIIVGSFSLGSRQSRTVAALQSIGPAVLNGGFSTFLAFVFTAGSSSHVFLSFFKVRHFFLSLDLSLILGRSFYVVLFFQGKTYYGEKRKKLSFVASRKKGRSCEV